MLQNKKQKIRFFSLAITILVIGFTLSFFYQSMIEARFEKFKENYDFSRTEDMERFLPLSGWEMVSGDIDYASLTSERASLIFYIPKKDAVALNFIIRFEDPKQKLSIYAQDKLLRTISASKANSWIKETVIMPYALAEEGLNKLIISKSYQTTPDFKELVIQNYHDRNLMFMRAYTIWESTRWYIKQGNKPVSLIVCAGSAVGLLLIWLGYSYIFRLFTDKNYLYVLKIDFWTYLPAILIFMSLFVIGKVISTYTFFYYKLDYWLILFGSTSIGKTYQIIKHVSLKKVVLRIDQLKEGLSKNYDNIGNAFIIIFIVLFISCSILLKYKVMLTPTLLLAETVANWAFLFLSMGIAVKLIGYFANRKS